MRIVIHHHNGYDRKALKQATAKPAFTNQKMSAAIPIKKEPSPRAVFFLPLRTKKARQISHIRVPASYQLKIHFLLTESHKRTLVT